MIRTNWLASSHILKMAGQSFGKKKYYGLTVTVSSEEWWRVQLPKKYPVFLGGGIKVPMYSHTMSLVEIRLQSYFQNNILVLWLVVFLVGILSTKEFGGNS